MKSKILSSLTILGLLFSTAATAAEAGVSPSEIVSTTQTTKEKLVLEKKAPLTAPQLHRSLSIFGGANIQFPITNESYYQSYYIIIPGMKAEVNVLYLNRLSADTTFGARIMVSPANPWPSNASISPTARDSSGNKVNNIHSGNYLFFHTKAGIIDIGYVEGTTKLLGMGARKITKASEGISGDWPGYLMPQRDWNDIWVKPGLYSHYQGLDKTSLKISYFTNQWENFKFGASYIRQQNKDANKLYKSKATYGNIVELGANYFHKLGDQFKIGLAAVAEVAMSRLVEDNKPVVEYFNPFLSPLKTLGLGTVAQFEQIEVAGSYNWIGNYARSWDIGAAITVNDWKASASYFRSANHPRAQSINNLDRTTTKTPQPKSHPKSRTRGKITRNPVAVNNEYSEYFHSFAIGIEREILPSLVGYVDFIALSPPKRQYENRKSNKIGIVGARFTF